ncbi:MAG: hypothetical protein IIW08_00780 [Clostridia bacterium]|nr:hypothetical protein [Clostridia bacterium]MBQ2434306.1 hypothetical protein [Clostridia bacterium]MBQ5769689.1 hypothetical protein [Clostridia bacterium]
MKSFAKFLTGITVVIVALLAYYLYSSNIPVIVSVKQVNATEKSDEFYKIREDIENGKYEGVSAPHSIDSYFFVTLSVSAKNFSPFPAEWAQFVPKSAGGDIIVLLNDAGPKDIGRFKEAEFTVTVLTSNPEAYRTGWLEYYILGRFHSVEAQRKG